MKYLILVSFLTLVTMIPNRAQAQELDGCGVLAGAISVYATASVPGRIGAVIAYISGMGGYAAGANACDVGSIRQGEYGGTPPSVADQIRDAMCPYGDCATVEPLPDDPWDCFLVIDCPGRTLPDDQWISANDFLNAATFVDNAGAAGYWPWDVPWDNGDFTDPY